MENVHDVELREQYSFSKLSSWWTCPYGYKLRYEDHKTGEGNAFSSYGSLIHSIMERYAKGMLEIWDMPSVFEWEFDAAIPYKFPWNKYVVLKDTYFDQGLDYLKHFQGYDNYEILGVEDKFTVEIDDWDFVGVIDLLFKDENNRLIIRDYKSKSSFKNDEERDKYARQLYLYSIYVKQKYGKFPDALQFSMFRKQKIVEIDFSESAYSEALEWAKKTVRIIREAIDYPATCDQFYGENLCNFRNQCDLKPQLSKPFRRYGRK